MMLPTCPDCAGAGIADLGPLPDVPVFAGKRLDHALPGGRLLRCRQCDLRFRWPLLPNYDELYNNGEAQAWSAGPLRHDQSLVHGALSALSVGNKLLDFGCYSGGFLCAAPARFERYGVEVSQAAAAVARERAGAQVVGHLDDFDPAIRFDVIVAMDVVEHVASPRRLLEQFRQRLSPGGKVLLTTGDGANLLWRIVRARWWYCYFPEHIAFISRRWLAVHAGRLGLGIERVETFDYLQSAAPGTAPGWRAWLRYLAMPARHARKRARHLAAHGTDMGVPGIGLTRDHLLIQLGA